MSSSSTEVDYCAVRAWGNSSNRIYPGESIRRVGWARFCLVEVLAPGGCAHRYSAWANNEAVCPTYMTAKNTNRMQLNYPRQSRGFTSVNPMLPASE